MSDFLGKPEQLSFDYDATLEVVTTEVQKLGIATSGTVILQRPDKLRATRTGDYASLEMFYDGQSFSVLAHDAAAYLRLPVEGNIDADRSIFICCIACQCTR